MQLQLEALGLRVRPDAFTATKMTYGFWDVPAESRALYTHPGAGRVFIYYTDDNPVYGFPINESGTQFKAAVHVSPHAVDPDDVTPEPEQDLISQGKQFLRRFCKGTGVGEKEEGNAYGNCLYTIPRPDHDGSTFSVVDALPNDNRVVVVGALHGQGFKM